MARLKAIIEYEYEADPENYADPRLTAEVMASIDQETLVCNPELALEQENLRVRVEVMCE